MGLHRTSANRRRWPWVVMMLGHRLRRWPNIITTLGQRLVFAGTTVCWEKQRNTNVSKIEMIGICSRLSRWLASQMGRIPGSNYKRCVPDPSCQPSSRYWRQNSPVSKRSANLVNGVHIAEAKINRFSSQLCSMTFFRAVMTVVLGFISVSCW